MQFDMAERGRRLTAFKEATAGKQEVELAPGEWRFVTVWDGDRPLTIAELELLDQEIASEIEEELPE